MNNRTLQIVVFIGCMILTMFGILLLKKIVVIADQDTEITTSTLPVKQENQLQLKQESTYYPILKQESIYNSIILKK